MLVDGRTVEVQRKPPASYGYDHVCDEHQTQSEIFESVGVPVTDAFLEGYHGCLIAYGQTGAGKTFTIFGSDANPGLAPRILRHLYDAMGAIAARGRKWSCSRRLICFGSAVAWSGTHSSINRACRA